MSFAICGLQFAHALQTFANVWSVCKRLHCHTRASPDGSKIPQIRHQVPQKKRVKHNVLSLRNTAAFGCSRLVLFWAQMHLLMLLTSIKQQPATSKSTVLPKCVWAYKYRGQIDGALKRYYSKGKWMFFHSKTSICLYYSNVSAHHRFDLYIYKLKRTLVTPLIWM